MLMMKIYSWLFCCSCVLATSAIGATSVIFGDTLIQHFSVNEGLPSRAVTGSIYDENHLLWIGTDAGVCRSDGNRIRGFSSFPQLFNGIFLRGADSLFFAINPTYPDSVELLNPANLNASGARLGSPKQGYFAGSFQKDRGRLYFARGSGIYTFHPGRVPEMMYVLPAELNPGDLLVYVDENGYLLYDAKKKHFSEMTAAGKRFFSMPSTVPPLAVYRDRNARIWLSTADGLFLKQHSETEFVPIAGLPSGQEVNFFSEDLRGNLFIGCLDPIMKRMTDLDLVTAEGRSSATWLTKIDSRIRTISGEDFQREIRLNTYGGLFIVGFSARQKPFKRYLYRELAPGKFGDVMRGFAADDKGNVYTNKDSGMPFWFRVNVGTLELDTLRMIENDGSLANHYGCGTNLINYQGDIFGHSCDMEGDAFWGTVYRYRPADGSWKKWSLPVQHEVVRWVTNGRTDDELLMITEHKINHRQGSIYYFYPARDSFALVQTAGPAYGIHGYTKGVIRDTTRNCLWFGTDAAFYRFDFATEKLQPYFLGSGKNTAITDVLLMANGKLLVGTFQRGIQLFDPATGRFTLVGGLLNNNEELLQKGDFLELPSNDISAIRPAGDGYFLIFTFNGLALHGPASEATSVFTTEDGLGNNEFNTASAFFNTTDQRWYAGGINGFVSFSIEDLIPEASPFRPAMLSYRLLDEDANNGNETAHIVSGNWQGPLVLPPTVVYSTLEFAIPDFQDKNKARFQTFLEGFDPDWTSPTPTPSVRYTRLDPGEYLFKLRAYDGNGRLSPEIIEIPIVVLAPWFKTWWFYLSLGALSALSLYLIHRRRLARLQQKMEISRRVQSLELRSLRQQLNPHFISNAMNAIREYIQREGKEDSARYLTDFSLMMRLFLESSRRRLTCIADETDMLRRYIGLEELRFSGKFTSSITIDPEIDPIMDEVPSLLLQPIVENAINHGLFPLPSGGELKIHFGLDPNDDDVIICTISDNGVGRKIAAQRPKTPGHISRATTILEDRQRLLAEDDRILLHVETTDLYPDREHTGTLVTIRIEGG